MNSVLGRRISRRRALGAGATLAAAGAALAIVGCDDSEDAASDAPVRGGTLRHGTVLPTAYGLDPQIETATGLAIAPKLYGYLLHVDPRDDSVVYDHAESVEQPDATTYIVRLREGPRFHDVDPVRGRPVFVYDVLRSIDRYRSNPLVVSRMWHDTILDRVEALDYTTAKFTLKRPYVYSLSEMGSIAAGAIIAGEATDRFIDLGGVALGSGPFMLDHADERRIRIRRFGEYHRTPVPYLDAMSWEIFDSDDAMLAALNDRRIDTAPLRDSSAAEATRDIDDELQVTSEPSLSYLSLGLQTSRTPMSDERVRLALDLALDRESLIRNVALGGGTALGPVNPHLGGGFWALPRNEVQDALDGSMDERRARAKSLMEAAGVPILWFTMQVPSQPALIDLAGVIREQLARVGVGVAIEELPMLRWFLNFRRGSFEATLINHVPYETPDIPARFYHSAGPDNTQNPFGFSNTEIDSLVARSWEQEDREERRDTLLEAQRLMLDARPMLQLYSGIAHHAAWRYVRNRRPELMGSMARYHVEQWLDEGAGGRATPVATLTGESSRN